MNNRKLLDDQLTMIGDELTINYYTNYYIN